MYAHLLPVIQNSEIFMECCSLSLCEFAVHLLSKTKLQSSHQAATLFLLTSKAFNLMKIRCVSYKRDTID